MMSEATRRLRHVVARLRSAPGHTLTMIGTIAVGVASASALFSVVNGIALRELSLPDASRVMSVSTSRANDMRASGQLAAADLAELRARVTSLDLAAFSYSEFVLAGDPAAERVIGAAAESQLFATLGVRPLLGRVFGPGEDGPAAARVVVLAYPLWVRRFGSDASVVGRSIVIDGAPHTVIGVMPRGFEFPRSARMAREVELWTPLPFTISASAPRGRGSLVVLGRLRRGTTIEAARTELRTAGGELATRYASTNAGLRFDVMPLREQVIGPARPALFGMSVGVVLLLAILCISVAHLSVLRGLGETRSLAIRVALGGSPTRAIWPLAAESIMNAASGGAIGLALGIPLRSLLLALAPDSLPRRAAVVTDWRVVVFAAVLSLAIGIIASVLPLVRLRRVDLRGLLNESSRSATSRRGRRWRDAFVLSEIALTTVLLAGGVALFLTMLRLQRIDPGFRAEGVLTASVSISGPKYRSRDARALFLESYLTRVRALPGVEAAASVNLLPLAGGIMSAGYRVDAVAEEGDSTTRHEAAIRSVSDGYFTMVAQRVLQGRAIGARDVGGAQPVAVVNATLARQIGVRQPVLGSRIHIASGMIDTSRAYEVVGVVADAKETDLRAPATPVIYLSNQQAPYPYNNFVIRARGGPGRVVPGLRAALGELDPDLALDEVSSLDARLRGGYGVDYFLLALLSSFAVLSLVLVGVGVYGVVARRVQSELRAIGVRLALGATPGGVRWAIGGDALGLGGAGALIGVATAGVLWVWTPWVTFARSAIGAGTVVVAMTIAAGFMVLVCGLAAVRPAIRAGRLDPVAIMRDE